MTAYIYTLCDPNTGAIRYVGKTTKTARLRLSDHLSAARNPGKHGRSHVRNWIASIGYRPQVRVLCAVPAEAAGWFEQRAIAVLRRSCALTNMTDGGDGTPGRRLSALTRARISAGNRGRVLPPEEAARKAAILRGLHADPAFSAKLRDRMRKLGREVGARRKGRKWTPEERERLMALIKPISEETRRRLSAAHKGRLPWNTGRILTPEHCAKIGAGQVGRKHSEESKRKRSEKMRGRKPSAACLAAAAAAHRGKKAWNSGRRKMGLTESVERA